MCKTVKKINLRLPTPKRIAKLKPLAKKYYVFVTNNEYGNFINSIITHVDTACMDIQEINSDKRYVLIQEKHLKNFIDTHPEFSTLFDKLNDGSHECYNCGCISNLFYPDYRGQLCLSKVYNCEFCHSLNDKAYNDLGENRNIKKYM